MTLWGALQLYWVQREKELQETSLLIGKGGIKGTSLLGKGGIKGRSLLVEKKEIQGATPLMERETN